MLLHSFIFYAFLLYIPLCLYFNLRHRWRRRNLMSFTFHYVSILMYFFRSISRSSRIFTFHYVSILMQLLTQRIGGKQDFTFHYVSILIIIFNFLRNFLKVFTFHYVSILIIVLCHIPDYFILLYIPLCLYFNPPCCA